VLALAVFDDGGGPALYAAGGFNGSPGAPLVGIAKWNGTAWTEVGGGISGESYLVRALAVFDDGSGPALYAGGSFSHAGGVPANGIAKWDGAAWSGLGSGVNGWVRALAVHDDGTGAGLYAGGSFTEAGGQTVNHVARWDGTSWSGLAGGVSAGSPTNVSALASFDGGAGPELVAGGAFAIAGGVVARNVARWNGSAWSPLGGGLQAGTDAWGAVVNSLAAVEVGGASGLYAGGGFLIAGGMWVSYVARWDGASWSELGDGLIPATVFQSSLYALAGFDDGLGTALFAGGNFAAPGGERFIAKWGCATKSVPGCAGNPASLAALTPSAGIGAPLPLLVTASAAVAGFAQVRFGAPGTGAGGCGIVIPGIGELLLALAPPPGLLASGVLVAGASSLVVQVPGIPALIGLTAHLQGVAVDPLIASPIELINGLALKLGPP